jgi:pimeloyl-ACP methyl ester carboxylesterase
MGRAGAVILTIVLLPAGGVDTPLAISGGGELGRSREETGRARAAAAPAEAGDAAHALALTPCPRARGTEEARCGTLAVFENRAAASGRTIDLNVMVWPARERKAEADPVFFLAGGPGQAATWVATRLGGMLSGLNRRRDLVFVDARGSGGSNRLECHEREPRPMMVQLLERPFFLPTERGALRACMTGQEADLTLYATPWAADDLEEVRVALGYDRINLVAFSYGTRTALVYLRRHPGRVRAAFLRGVAPPGAGIPLSLAVDAQAALDDLLAACEADDRCREEFPDSAGRLERLLRHLERMPARVNWTDPASGKALQLEITRHGFALQILRMLYSSEWAVRIPAVIRRAHAGNLMPFLRETQAIGHRLGADVAHGLLLSVYCTEDAPLFESAEPPPGTAGTFLGSWPLNMMKMICSVWPRGTLPPAYHEPVRSDVPVLLVSGEVDPVTPPRWAREAARKLSASRTVILPATSHLGANRCVTALMEAFIDRGTTKHIDMSCVEKQRRPPFVIR